MSLLKARGRIRLACIVTQGSRGGCCRLWGRDQRIFVNGFLNACSLHRDDPTPVRDPGVGLRLHVRPGHSPRWAEGITLSLEIGHICCVSRPHTSCWVRCRPRMNAHVLFRNAPDRGSTTCKQGSLSDLVKQKCGFIPTPTDMKQRT